MAKFMKWVGVLCCAVSVQAAEFYVATNGDDANPGTLEQPLATLQAAVGKLQPGDACLVRGGTYAHSLEIVGLKGTAEAPIIFRAYGDETVVLDGTVRIESSWTAWTNGIFKTAVERDMWQLFAGRDLLDLARWPDASVNDGSVWDVHRSMRSTDRNWDNKLGRSESITQPGIIFDQNPADSHDGVNTQTLAETGKDFTGAIAVRCRWGMFGRFKLNDEMGQNEDRLRC